MTLPPQYSSIILIVFTQLFTKIEGIMPLSKAYFLPIIFLFSVWSRNKIEALVTKATHKQTDWFLEMQSPQPNWFKVEALNRAYFKAHLSEKSQKRRHCERWLQGMRPHLDTEGFVQMPFVPKETFLPQKINTCDEKCG